MLRDVDDMLAQCAWLDFFPREFGAIVWGNLAVIAAVVVVVVAWVVEVVGSLGVDLECKDIPRRGTRRRVDA
jgi:hypothetical protein